MPIQIMNQALYADRTVQDWHRRELPHNADSIDLDLLGVCQLPYCRKALYAIESTTRDNKPVSILNRLAKDVGCFALVVQHDTESIVSFRITHNPTGFPIVFEGDANTQLKGTLAKIRLDHMSECHDLHSA